MVFLRLFNYFVNNPQLVDKLAESYPIRRAAQLTVYAYHKSKSVTQGPLQDGAQRLKAFSKTFQDEVQHGWQESTKDPTKKR